MKPEIIFYTDGACLDNPKGPGGYGVVLITERNGSPYRKELSGGFTNTTNNRMEMMAVIVGLESLKVPCSVSVYSDSKYIVDAISLKWVDRWRRNGWRIKPGSEKRPKNIDLWKRMLSTMEGHEVRFNWVQGHAGIEENERCDYLANTAALGIDLPRDKSDHEGDEQELKLF
jgi:ribonuclease HI